MAWFKRLMYAAFCSSFHVGNPDNDHRNVAGHVVQDGLYSALQVFVLFLSMTVAISFAGRFQMARPLDLQFITLSKALFLSLTCLIMMIWMMQALYWCCRNRMVGNNGHQPLDQGQGQGHHQLDAQTFKRWAKLLIPLIGMFMFMAGAIVLDIQAIIAYGTCLSDTEWGAPKIYIWYHTLKIVFFMAVFVLCCLISTESQQDRNFFFKRYSLCLILVMVIWLAIDCQLNESKDLFKTPTAECRSDSIFGGNITTPSMSYLKHHSCECEVLGVFERKSGVEQYLYPFITEFCLLASECILHRLFHHSKKLPVPQGEGQPLRCPTSFPLLQSIALLVSLSLGVLYIVLPSYYGVHEPFTDGGAYTLAFYIYKIIYRSVIIMVTKTGFFFASYMDLADGGYTGYEMMVMLSAFGQYLFNTFDLAAITSYLYNYPKSSPSLVAFLSSTAIPSAATVTSVFEISYPISVLHLTSLVLAYYQIYTQTAFMLHTLKLKPVVGNESACKVVKACLTFLAMANLLLWVLESFVELKGLRNLYQVEAKFYSLETWTTLSEIIFPIMVFYRFNSAIVMVGTVLTY